MAEALIAIVGDISSARALNPALTDPAQARRAAEQLGSELARRGARLLVYGGPFLEADVVRGFVAAKPAKDHSILMWYTKDNEPPPFAEEADFPKLFQRRSERGADWEIAFYRSVARADGVILMGGGSATKISGQVAIGARIPILALPEFGGGAQQVWNSLSAGEDLPKRDEIDVMEQRWSNDSANACVQALFSQLHRRRLNDSAPNVGASIIAGLLFVSALAIVPLVWGRNAFAVWMLFIAPMLAGGAGAGIRPMVDRQRGTPGIGSTVLATIILGLVAGGIAGVLFVTAQLTADPKLIATADAADLLSYAERSIPFAVGIGFVSGLTSDAVFGKLLGLEVIRTGGVATARPQ